MSEEVVSEVVDIDGVELEVITELTSTREWLLVVRNPLGVMTVWNDCFPTAKEAIAAGLDAIEKEGLAEFMDLEGFEYLLH